MKYRSFGSLDVQTSVLGFGCMRLPVIGDDYATIDEPEAARLLSYAIDHGVNYLDTAYDYHRGSSEIFLSQFLATGYRDKIKLATKLPPWEVETREDFDRILDVQLQRLGETGIDFYLLHGLTRERWRRLHDLGILAWAERQMSDRRIEHLGFSFHDTYDALTEIIDAYDGWSLCQIQYNYLDEGIQATRAGIEYAASKGLAVVIMEPIRGGRLASAPPSIQRLWDRSLRKRKPAEWALRWVWNHPEVSVALSGMSAMDQVVENVASASEAEPNQLSECELQLISQVRDKYLELCPIPCTECRYCSPCPNGVLVHRNFGIYNWGAMYGNMEQAQAQYHAMHEGQRASACVQCGVCEEVCPQRIPIIEWLDTVHEALD